MQELFLQGQFDALVALGLRGEKAVQGNDWALVVAALARMGRVPEAEALLRAVAPELAAGAWGFAAYHVYPAPQLKGSRSAAPFYVWHALARGRFAAGRLGKALALADRAAPHRKKAFFPAYAVRLDAELRLHLHGMRGELALAEAAYDATEKSSDLSLMYALYQARHGRGEAALHGIRAETPAQGASLELERSRLQLLAGHEDIAQRTLTRAAHLIEPLGHPRFDRALLLRRVDLHMARWELPEASVLIRVLSAGVDEAQEAVAALEIASRAIACQKAMGRADELQRAAVAFARLKELTTYVVPRHPEPRERAPRAEGLNARQLTFLEELAPEGFASVHEYRERFGVSEITACRDLARMVAQGVLRRYGRARATRYAHSEKVVGD